MHLPRPNEAIAALVGAALASCSPAPATREEPARSELGLFTSLPIYWGEGEIEALIEGGQERGWARGELEKRFDLVPLDALEPETLEGIHLLLLAQPRPLAPSENVALDDWLRKGGQLLLFADPMLTRPSRYPLGDPRRPQDVVLLSPILDRWGLALQFDESQPEGERWVATGAGELPVNLAGRFVATRDGVGSDCAISASGIAAECRVGAGRVILLADAALFDGGFPSVPRRDQALHSHLSAAFDSPGKPRDGTDSAAAE